MITKRQIFFLLRAVFYVSPVTFANAQVLQLKDLSSIETIQQNTKYLEKKDITTTLLQLVRHQAPNLGESLKVIPVQFKGRLQPFDTFARNSLRSIYGKDSFNNISATDVLVSWMLLPDYWNHTSFVRVEKAVLKRALKLDLQRGLFTPLELLNNPIFMRELRELKSRVVNKEDLSSYFKDIQNLENQLALYLAFQKGKVPGFFPSSADVLSSTWLSLDDKDRLQKNNKINKTQQQYLASTTDFESFQKIILSYISAVSAWTTDSLGTNLQKQQRNLELAVYNFQQQITINYPAYKNLFSKMKLETKYNHLNPFRLAWLCYLLGLLLLYIYYLCRRRISVRVFHKMWIAIPIFVLFSGFCLHTYGIVLRSIIMSRPPVTNMYETVIWVPWVAMILGSIIWVFQKFSSIFIGSVVASLCCLLLADMAPYSLLNGRLEPLEAVLNSNFWLSTHVLIITMSYGAFLLAFLLGDMCLCLFLLNKTETTEKRINQYVKAINRSIQIGVVLLALGTILGGIWADYSWGRFWGWDPKETWALISLLGYLVLLHGRLMGWVREFGMVVGSILIFFLIVMAWYGVNYVLGQGLHSYGFGSGGVEYVLSFAILHLIYVLWVWTWRKKIS